MTLFIRFNSAGTHADVWREGEGAPAGSHRLQPGESYYAVPYDTWSAYTGQTVDVMALQHAAAAGGRLPVGQRGRLDPGDVRREPPRPAPPVRIHREASAASASPSAEPRAAFAAAERTPGPVERWLEATFPPRSSLVATILVDGILKIGVPYAVVTALLREWTRPSRVGWEPEIFLQVLGIRLSVSFLITGPLFGWLLWRRHQRRADRG